MFATPPSVSEMLMRVIAHHRLPRLGVGRNHPSPAALAAAILQQEPAGTQRLLTPKPLRDGQAFSFTRYVHVPDTLTPAPNAFSRSCTLLLSIDGTVCVETARLSAETSAAHLTLKWALLTLVAQERLAHVTYHRHAPYTRPFPREQAHVCLIEDLLLHDPGPLL